MLLLPRPFSPPGARRARPARRAYELRERVAAAEIAWYERTEALLDPFRPRADGGPPRRARKHLHRLARAWRALGGFGQLRCMATVDAAGALQILETRLLRGEVVIYT